jgi:hypothetical protein
MQNSSRLRLQYVRLFRNPLIRRTLRDSQTLQQLAVSKSSVIEEKRRIGNESQWREAIEAQLRRLFRTLRPMVFHALWVEKCK